eukprot:365974-Chlamydomonas_euryale.AAC.10
MDMGRPCTSASAMCDEGHEHEAGFTHHLATVPSVCPPPFPPTLPAMLFLGICVHRSCEPPLVCLSGLRPRAARSSTPTRTAARMTGSRTSAYHGATRSVAASGSVTGQTTARTREAPRSGQHLDGSPAAAVAARASNGRGLGSTSAVSCMMGCCSTEMGKAQLQPPFVATGRAANCGVMRPACGRRPSRDTA